VVDNTCAAVATAVYMPCLSLSLFSLSLDERLCALVNWCACEKIIRKGAGQREGEWNLLSVDEDDGAQPPAGTTAERALLRFFDFFFFFFF
jgi:hypothetical protein